MGMWFLNSFQSVWLWNAPATEIQSELKEGRILGRHCPAEQLWMKGKEFLKENTDPVTYIQLRNDPAWGLA